MTSAARREAVDIVVQSFNRYLSARRSSPAATSRPPGSSPRLTPSTSQSTSRRRTQSSVLALSSLSCRLILRLRRLGPPGSRREGKRIEGFREGAPPAGSAHGARPLPGHKSPTHDRTVRTAARRPVRSRERLTLLRSNAMEISQAAGRNAQCDRAHRSARYPPGGACQATAAPHGQRNESSFSSGRASCGEKSSR